MAKRVFLVVLDSFGVPSVAGHVQKKDVSFRRQDGCQGENQRRPQSGQSGQKGACSFHRVPF